MELNTFKILRLFNSPAAIAKGPDLLPGHKIKFLTPIFVKRSKSCKLLKKFWHSIDDVIIYINTLEILFTINNLTMQNPEEKKKFNSKGF